jgi:AcrR family transcriptional regulator
VSPSARHRARRGEGERLHEEILAAAQALLLETADTSAVSIRAVADRVGVTAPSIYRHFADKDALMMAVCGNVFQRLDDSLEKAAAGAADPLDELLRKGRAYVEFGLAYPEHYRLLFMIKPPVHHEPDEHGPRPGDNAFVHLQETVERVLALADDDVERPDAYDMTCAIWSGVHGITSLRIAFADFPWPPIDTQLHMMVDPWRDRLCPSLHGEGKRRARS